jgi:parallel beta-helix repeat protein
MILTILICQGSVLATVYTVDDDGPANFTHIQDAINAAGYGDTIAVKSGYYPENITLKDGVSIFGQGYEDTWLRGTGTGNVVTAVDITSAQLDGLAIYHSGTGISDAGVYISGGDVVISNNWIIENIRGIQVVGGSSSIIRNNLIEYNGDPDNGFVDYGICCLSSTPLISNNLIRYNEVGIYMAWSDSAGARIINNTIVSNEWEGVWCYQEANVIIKNNIVVNNNTGIDAIYDAIPQISYNCVWGNTWHDYYYETGGYAAPGIGDISEDPCFVDTTHYYLSKDSPCINAGDPDPVYNDIDGTRNDMGYTGGPDGSTGPLFGGLLSGFVFTTVGKIPVNEITQTDPNQGLANVTIETASNLHIYQYKDAPFGGNLWIQGLFGPNDIQVQYYRILVAKWTGERPPSITDAVPLTDSLIKTYYTILSDGTVKAQQWNCGPYSIGGMDGFYLLTEEGYWANRDLRIIWLTGSWPNGKYTVFYKAYNSDYNEEVLPGNTQDHFIIMINNTNVQAQIHAVKRSTGEVIPECGMIDVATDDENVQFVITARHPDGYLRDYTLHALYGANRDGGDVAHDQYVGVHDVTPPYWYGVLLTTFDSHTAWLSGMLDGWHTCAYEFRLNVYARTTDGYNHLYWNQFNDHYYVKVGSCAWCCGADINHSGKVDFVDFATFASHWLETCQP